MKGLGFDLGAEPPCIKFCQEPILLSTPHTNSAFLHSRKRPAPVRHLFSVLRVSTHKSLHCLEIRYR